MNEGVETGLNLALPLMKDGAGLLLTESLGKRSRQKLLRDDTEYRLALSIRLEQNAHSVHRPSHCRRERDFHSDPFLILLGPAPRSGTPFPIYYDVSAIRYLPSAVFPFARVGKVGWKSFARCALLYSRSSQVQHRFNVFLWVSQGTCCRSAVDGR